jgi:hypothetical protein
VAPMARITHSQISSATRALQAVLLHCPSRVPRYGKPRSTATCQHTGGSRTRPAVAIAAPPPAAAAVVSVVAAAAAAVAAP